MFPSHLCSPLCQIHRFFSSSASFSIVRETYKLCAKFLRLAAHQGPPATQTAAPGSAALHSYLLLNLGKLPSQVCH
jgi:hypothetical protein